MKNKLPELRKDKGWSQSNLGDYVSVSRQTINAIEKGRYDPSLSLAFKISHAFGLSIEQIFIFEENEV
ncbi:helix-turn-helix transcriptional regulator [Acinetobacter gyllenbergii]|nr:helix-turn-helix transcriptional regulator [Acinetobacter gyllenbergii]